MNYDEALKYIKSIPKFSKTLGNDDLRRLLTRLGNPQDRLSFIHVAGTNGKGSVCAMTSSILRAAGYKVGLYTSPFIEIFNERIQINGQNIPNDALCKVATIVKHEIEALGIEISAFAQITAMAFLYFAEEKCDLVVLETGLGGRLDATNVIKAPKACAITKIGLDHTEYLGDTIEKIAAEKCGIIKFGAPVVTCSSQDGAAMSVILSACSKNNSRLFVTDEYSGKLGLLGDYQKSNAAIAEKTAQILGISEAHITRGLADAKWIARFEFLRDNLVLDGGHNPDGVRALIKSLKKLGKRVVFVVAMMQDKDIGEVSAEISAFAERVIVTEVNVPRCIGTEALADYFPGAQIEKDSIRAVEKALADCQNDELVCVCGSLYLAGEIRPHFTA